MFRHRPTRSIDATTTGIVVGATVVAAIVYAVWLVLFNHNLIDLSVYRWGGEAVLAGESLYGPAEDRSVTIEHPDAVGLPFTYPPFSALLFVPAALLSWTGAQIALTMVSFLCLGRVMWLLLSATMSGFPRTRLWAYPLSMVGTLTLDPTINTFGFGQINLLLLWLIVEDTLGFADKSRLSGVMTGLATAIKLTPGIFVVGYLTVREWRRSIIATVTFAVTIVVPVIFLGVNQVKRFWTQALWDAGRVGGEGYALNQSLNGFLWRTLAAKPETWILGVLSILMLIGGLWVFRRLWNDDRIGALAGLSLAMLLISPISWTHHWVWAIPALIFLLLRVSNAMGYTLFAIGMAMMILQLPWRVPQSNDVELLWNGWQFVVGNSYFLWAVLTLGYLVYFSAIARKPSPTDPAPDATRM